MAKGQILGVLMAGLANLARNFRDAPANIVQASKIICQTAQEARTAGRVWDARIAPEARTAGPVSVVQMDAPAPTTADQVLTALAQITASRALTARGPTTTGRALIAPIVRTMDAPVSTDSLSIIVQVSDIMPT